MVHCGKEDFIVGFIIYTLIHPEHKLDPNNKPATCPNTNYFLDGMFADLYEQADWGGSIRYQLGDIDNNSLANPNDCSDEAWHEICCDYETVKANAINTFKQQYIQTINILISPNERKMFGYKALPTFERIVNLAKQANIELPTLNLDFDVSVESIKHLIKQDRIDERLKRRQLRQQSQLADSNQ